MGKFVFERDYETLLNICEGDEDLAMDVVVSSLESEQKCRNRSMTAELSLQIERRNKSKDVMDSMIIEPLDIATIDKIDYYLIYDHIDEGLLYEMLNVLSTLSEREIEVLYYRFFRGFTLDRTGNEFGVGKERIRQVEAKALRKLRHPQRAMWIRDYAYPGYENDGRNICYTHTNFSDFHKFMDMAVDYKNKHQPKTLLEAKKKKMKKRTLSHASLVISRFCRHMEDFMINGAREITNKPPQFEYNEMVVIRKDIFKDVDKFVNSIDIYPFPYVLKRAIKLTLEEVYYRCTTLNSVYNIINLLYFKDTKLTGYKKLKEIIRSICPFTQKATYAKQFNEKDEGWIEYYNYRWNHGFIRDKISYYNMPKELQTIITVPSYVEYYKEHGPVFSDIDDLLLYSLYNDDDNVYYHNDSLIGYIKNVYYEGLDMSMWGIYDEEQNIQYNLYQLYKELDYDWLFEAKFPIVEKLRLTGEELETNAWNYINTVLYKAISPKIYVRTVMLGYYYSMIFLHTVGYANIESRFGIPIKYISQRTDSFDIEDKKKIAMISNVFIWGYNKSFVKFSIEDFFAIYNNKNFEYALDRIMRIMKRSSNLEKEDASGDVIESINAIIYSKK